MVNRLEQYIEYVFIENLIINILILILIKKVSRKDCKKLNLGLSAIITSTYSCLSYTYQDTLNTLFIKILVSFIYIYIAFKPKNIKTFIRLIMYYILIYFIFIGIIISLTLILKINIPNLVFKWLVYIASIVLTYGVCKIMWKVWKKNIKKDELLIDIKIYNCNIRAFVDTGNTVKGSNNLPVIFINEKYKKVLKNELEKENKEMLKIDTINGSKICYTYLIKNVNFKVNKNQIVVDKINIAFTDMLKDDSYDAITSYDIYLDLLERGNNNE